MVKKRDDYAVGKDVSNFIDRTRKNDDPTDKENIIKDKRTSRISLYVSKDMRFELEAVSKMRNQPLTLTIAELLDEVLQNEKYQKMLKAYNLAQDFLKS